MDKLIILLVTCPNLVELRLLGLNVAGLIFSHEIPIASIAALRKVEVARCPSLKSLFSALVFRELVNLEFLVIDKCLALGEVVEEDSDNQGGHQVMKVVITKPKLEVLVLGELPMMRRFSCSPIDIELPSLKTMRFMEMQSSSSLAGSLHIPSWVKVHGISDPELASQLFFNREHGQDDDNLDKGCFMLFPSDLSFTWPSQHEPFLVKGLSDVFYADGWEKTCGRFEIEKLPPGVLMYEISLVIMLIPMPDHNVSSLKLTTIIADDDKREVDLSDMPTEQWIQILAGEIRGSFGECGEIVFSVVKNFAAARVVLKGVSIRPKETAA